MPANFQELLGVQVESVEPPVVFPPGPYAAVTGKYETGESSQKGTPFVRFPVKLLGPLDGVDMDQFEAAGGLEKLSTRSPLRLDFFLTPDAQHRLRKFLENSLQLNCHNKTFDSVLPDSDGVQFVAVIGHQAGRNEGEVYMNITGHAAAE